MERQRQYDLLLQCGFSLKGGMQMLKYKMGSSGYHRVEIFAAIAIIAAGATSCSKLSGMANNSTSFGTTTTATASTVSMKVVDQTSSTTIYTDTSTNKTFSLTAGKAYALEVTATNLPTGAVLAVAVTNTSLPNATAQVLPFASGETIFTPAVAGDYTVKVMINSATGSNLMTQNYSAGVACQTPTFTANSLSANGLTVTGSNNLYTYSASGVISAANGQAPYQCAYDLTGVGIVDTAFTDCTVPVTNQYSPYVSARNIGVIVKDSCNTSYSVSKSLTLTAAVPVAPGNVFITGTVSAETGSALTDTRIHGVHFSSINTGGYNVVQPSYGGTNYSIQTAVNYGQPSSVAYGMKIDVTGLAGTFNLTNNVTGTIDASHASIAQVLYKTDQAGDQNPSVSLTSTTCTTTGIHAQVQNPQGVPCTAGSTGGSNNQATVEVWGDYTCTNATSSGGATVTLTGTFDGYTHLVDSCSGGGGGGGGIVPVQL
jgi:hypothetical protein